MRTILQTIFICAVALLCSNVYAQFPPQPHELSFTFENNAIPFKKDGKFGLLNLDGSVYLEPTYDTIYQQRGHTFAKSSGEFFRINEKGLPFDQLRFKSIFIEDDKLKAIKADGSKVFLPEFFHQEFGAFASLEVLNKSREANETGRLAIQIMDPKFQHCFSEIDFKTILVRKDQLNAVFKNVDEIRKYENLLVINYSNGSAEIVDFLTLKSLFKHEKLVVNGAYLSDKKLYLKIFDQNLGGLCLVDDKLNKACLSGDNDLVVDDFLYHSDGFRLNLKTNEKTEINPFFEAVQVGPYLFFQGMRSNSILFNETPIASNLDQKMIKSLADKAYLIHVVMASADLPEGCVKPEFKAQHNKEFPYYFQTEETSMSLILDNQGKTLFGFSGKFTLLNEQAMVGIVTTPTMKRYVQFDIQNGKANWLDYDFMVSIGSFLFVQQGTSYLLLDSKLQTVKQLTASSFELVSKDGHVMLVELISGITKSYLNKNGEIITLPEGKLKTINFVHDVSTPRHWMYTQANSKRVLLDEFGNPVDKFEYAEFREMNETGVLICLVQSGTGYRVKYYSSKGKLLSEF